MGLDKRMKKRIQQIDKNLDAIVKNPYEKEHIVEKKESRFPLWAKWAIPFGSVALACSLTLAIVLPVANKNGATDYLGGSAAAATNSQEKGVSHNQEPMGEDNSENKDVPQGSTDTLTSTPTAPHVDYNMLAPSTVNKYSDTRNDAMSQTTYDSYTAFAKKFASLMMQIGNANGEKSLGVSIPDAYLCFAISGIISDQASCNDVLSYLELDSVDELKTASREIVSTLGTLSKTSGSTNKYVGGYNLNSIWLDPNNTSLREGNDKDQDLYDDLANIYDVSLINEAFDEDKANQYLQDYGPNGMPSPEIELDGDSPALAVMSAFYYLDLLRETDLYELQYQRGNHLMNYTFGGTTKSVDYLLYNGLSSQYLEGNGFHAASVDMNRGSVYFYLPDSETAMPSTILQDVLNENYTPVTVTTESGYQSSWYPVDVEAPYFKMDNKIELKGQPLLNILPHITLDGMGSRLVSDSLFLSAIYQFSTMSFDYRGFYSASVTISRGDASAGGGPEFTLTLDHPFVFETRKTITIGTNHLTIPVVIGEVVDPAYPAYQAS